VMILAAAYLLWMFQRVVLNEPSPFLLGLKHHLTDMNAVEVLTLAPLGALVVAFGLFPGILLDLIAHPVAVTLEDAAQGTAIAVDPLVVAIGLGIVVAIIAIRFVAVLGRRGGDDPSTAVTVAGDAA
jgi:hypothetical protein